MLNRSRPALRASPRRSLSALFGACAIASACAGPPDGEPTPDAEPDVPACDGHNGGDESCLPLGECSAGFVANEDGHCVGVISLPDLHTGRAVHRATLLADGRTILVTGGRAINVFGDRLPLASTELLDLETLTWREGPDLLEPFAFHGAALLGNGQVVVAGNDPASRNTYLYDPVEDRWRTGPLMSRQRADPVVVSNSRGEVIVIGGDTAATVEVLDPEGTAWTGVAAQLEKPFYAHAACRVDDRRVLVDASAQFNLSTNLWEYPLETWVFDVEDFTLTPGPQKTTQHVYGHCVAMPDGSVVMSGGQYVAGTMFAPTTVVERASSLDAASFQAFSSLLGTWIDPRLVPLDGRRLLIASASAEEGDLPEPAPLSVINVETGIPFLVVPGTSLGRWRSEVVTLPGGRGSVLIGGVNAVGLTSSSRADFVKVATGFGFVEP